MGVLENSTPLRGLVQALTETYAKLDEAVARSGEVYGNAASRTIKLEEMRDEVDHLVGAVRQDANAAEPL